MRPHATRAPWLRGAAPYLIFAVALALRLYHLTYHSLWFDEVMSTLWAAKPAGEIWRVGLALTQDKHPPLYYLLLHGWTALFGTSDATVRAMGAVLGALAVFPTYAIGLRLGDRRAGVLGALFVALNPFLIWYSQEARMFMPATTFLLVGLYGILKLADAAPAPGIEASAGDPIRASNRPGPQLQLLVAGVCIVGGFTAALYTYLFSAFMLPVAFVWLVLMSWRVRGDAGVRRILAPGLAALALTGLFFLPLARSAWLVSGAEATPGRAFAGMGGAVWQLLRVYAFGWPGWPAVAVTALTAGAALLALGGMLAPLRSTDVLPPGGLLLAAWLGLPLLTGGLLLARDRTVFAESRYFIFLVPALCLAWGRALAWLWQRRRVAGLIALALALGLTVAALPSLWSAENRREAWRDAAAFVAAHAGPNDAVLVQADYVHPAFARYFRGPQPIFYPFTEPLSDPAQVDATLAGLAGFDAVWLVQSHHETLDPGGLVNGWFAARAPLITEVFPPGVAVRGYLQRYRLAQAPSGLVDAGETSGEGHRLLGCTIAPARLKATDDLFHPPSNWVHVTSYWQAGVRPERNAVEPKDGVPFVQMVDAADQVWGQSLERAGSSFERWPPSQWQPGEVIRADHEVNLNPATPPGRYRLVARFAGQATEHRCGEVEITP